ncbi:MAG: hypothetical protein ACR2GW_05040 [Pyrinomonadaceae bacterium]|nr:hypothetical protein [Acidobacteriota bacterium]
MFFHAAGDCGPPVVGRDEASLHIGFTHRSIILLVLQTASRAHAASPQGQSGRPFDGWFSSDDLFVSPFSTGFSDRLEPALAATQRLKPSTRRTLKRP